MTSVPVIIGVADIVNRSTKVEDAREPLALIVEAVQHSIKDSGVFPVQAGKLRSNIDSIDVVGSWTWPYPDLPGSIAKKLGIEVNHTHYTPHGGNQPGKIFDDAARRISQGKAKVAVCTGGEALASRESCLQVRSIFVLTMCTSNCLCCGRQITTTRLGDASREGGKRLLTFQADTQKQYVLCSRHCQWNEKERLIRFYRSWCRS